MQFSQSVECHISYKLDCLEKCDRQNFFKVQEEVLVTMQISLSDGDTISQVQFSSKTASKICDKLKKKSSTCKVLVAIQFIQAVGSPVSL